MSDRKFTVALELLGKSTTFNSALSNSQSRLRQFAQAAKREIDSIRHAWQSTTGKLAALGVGVGAVAFARSSERIRRSLNQIGLDAGKTADEIAGAKKELDAIANKYGRGREQLVAGFGVLQEKSGWNAAMQSMDAVTAAMSVLGDESGLVGDALATVARGFDFDLSKPEAAAEILNKMAGAGEGAGGWKNIFQAYVSSADFIDKKSMTFEKSLALMNTIGRSVTNPDDMPVVATAAMRMFSSLYKLKPGAAFSGIAFDEGGHTRDPATVLKAIRAIAKKGDDDAGTAALMRTTLEGADPKAMRLLMQVLRSPELEKNIPLAPRNLSAEYGPLSKNLNDQGARFKNLFETSLEGFSQPLIGGMADILEGINKQMAEGKMSAVDLMIGGPALADLAKTFLGPFANFFATKVGLLSGTIEGATLQKAAGVPSVYVVNYSEFPGGKDSGDSSGTPAKPGTGAGVPGVTAGGTKGNKLTAALYLAKPALEVAAVGYATRHYWDPLLDHKWMDQRPLDAQGQPIVETGSAFEQTLAFFKKSKKIKSGDTTVTITATVVKDAPSSSNRQPQTFFAGKH